MLVCACARACARARVCVCVCLVTQVPKINPVPPLLIVAKFV